MDRPPLPTFPVDKLGPQLGAKVNAVADELQVAPDLPAMLSLATIASAIGGRRDYVVRPGWREASPLWTATLAGPGERKSAVEASLTAPLREAERQLREKAQPEIEDAEQAVRIAKGRLEEAERAAIRAKADTAEMAASDAAVARRAMADLGPVPAPPRLLFGDITPAAMTIKAAENAGRMAVVHAEGTVIKQFAGIYNSGQSETGFALDAYDGKAVPVDRVQRGTTEMASAHLTIGLLVQPIIFEQLGRKRDDEMLHNGFVQRFLYSNPPSNLGLQDPRRSRPVPADVAAEYARRIHTLITNIWTAHESESLRLDADADELMYQFQEQMQPRLRNGGDLHSIASWASKLAGKLVRIAGALTLYDNAHARTITADYVGRALDLAPYFVAHARICLDLMGANRDAKLIPARDVLDWLRREKRKEPCSVRNAHRALHGRSWVDEGGADAVHAAMERLEEFGWLALIPPPERPPGTRGRKPSPEYDVHPWVHTPPTN
ncbi:YfjI family protein [Kitasatospora sp. NBC_00240]|uniref:YfjI family protein n=1 Tax=Kitasatospora sp. NBC_00240 TaxID=2903567 RepID=UPI00224D85DD|nr:YfjI family protein [Kitasatospora sp. NBC_00240]MCX5212996.1 YfjI family protein [Kitasatospora sp. NBC_00240]